MYQLLRFNYRTPIFPFVFKYQLQNRFESFYFYNTPPIELCAPDENFLWITHTDVTPNIIEFRYLISNYGRVFDCYKNTFATQVSKHNNGYRAVYLYKYKDPYSTESLNVRVHRLVAYYFLYFENCDLLEVNHINGIKHDNRACNLEWVTREQNAQHALRTGLIPLGEKRENAPISDKDADDICKMIMQGYSNMEIANIMNVPIPLVMRIKTGESYVNVSANYPNLKDMIAYSAPNLTEDQVRKICELLLQGYTMDKIAEIIGCTKTQVMNVRRGRNYTDISSEYNLVEQMNIKRKISEETIHALCKDMENPENTNAVLCRKYGISSGIISQIRSGKRHTEISSQYNIIKYEANKLSAKRLSENEINEICKDLENGISNQEIADKFNVGKSTVQLIKNRVFHTDISDNYNF